MFSMVALVFAVMTSAAHACMDISQKTSISAFSQDNDANGHDQSSSSYDCEMACGHCCVHHIMSNIDVSSLLPNLDAKLSAITESDIVLSDLVYGLKRPPKS